MPTFLELLAKRDTIAAETQLLLLQREQAALKTLRSQRHTRALLESYDAWDSADPLTSYGGSAAGLGSHPTDLYHPGAIGRHSARPGSRRHGVCPPFYFTEQQHWLIIDAARTVEAFCPSAVAVLDVLTQFAVYTGFDYTVVAKKDPEKPGELADPAAVTLAAKAQKIIDKWHRAVGWHFWEKEIFRRTRRDGEAFLIMEPDTVSGLLGLRSIEPEQVKEPADARRLNSALSIGGDESWRFGILTPREDTSIPLRYWVVSQYNETNSLGEAYEPNEVFHIKLNVDRICKRGVSDFFANVNDFPGVRKLLRALRESATVQANIAWIESHPPGMTPNIMGDTEPITSRMGKPAAAQYFDGPRSLAVSAGLEYTAGPMGAGEKNGALIQVLQAALRNIGARWQMPESLVSGDASNNNLASELAVAAPFTHAMECRQEDYVHWYREIHERVIEDAAARGVLGPARENILDDIQVSVEQPPVIPRDAKEETDRNLSLNQAGHLSNQTLAAREGLDFDDEQANIAESPIEPPSIMLGMQGEEGNGEEGSEETETEGAANE